MNAKKPKRRKTQPSKTDSQPRRKRPAKHAQREPIDPRRLWAFRVIVLIAAPILTLLLLEVALRIVGYGFPTAAILPCRVDGVASYCNNYRFAWRFFPPTIARTTEPFVFPARKSDETYRIFVLGGSAAAGTPDGSYSFGRFLQAMLRRQYPQVDFEVITVAMPAINSHVVLPIARDCARHQADLFVVYLGNNEVVGPYGAGTVFGPLHSSLSLIRLGIAAKATRVGQLVTALMQATGVTGAPRTWEGMGMVLDHQVSADDPRLQVVYRHFQRNLDDIRSVAQRSGAPIVFCTVGSNLKDNPPFASSHRPDVTDEQRKRWDELYQQGIVSETAGDYAGAISRYLEAAGVDDRYADLQFRLGRCYWAMGQFEQARQRYVMARELDTLRFRADDRINEIIRGAASGRTSEGVYLVDAEKALNADSPHDTAGAELFYEHVHLNFEGNYLLARSVVERIEPILPRRIADHKADGQAVPSADECASDLAYTAWDHWRVANDVLNSYVKRAPFTNQLYHEQRVADEARDVQALADGLSQAVMKEVDQQYHQSIDQVPADWWLHWNYGQLLESRENWPAAAEQYRQVVKLVPRRYEAHAKLGLMAGKQGDLNGAVKYNLEAVKLNPIYADAWFNLGFAYHLQGKFDECVKDYAKAARYKPDYAEAYKNLGVVLYQQGKVEEAIRVYRKALAVLPDELDLHYNLALILQIQGRSAEALQEFHKALEIDPNSAKVHQALDAMR
jgi:tetratricopeptide (TPR) repeat protein